MKRVRYLGVKWVNGVKVRREDLFGKEYWEREGVKGEGGRSVRSYKYGVGEVVEGIGENVEIEI